MSHIQYLKMLEREIQRVNKKIDWKIIQGRDYFKEAREHKLLLQKVRYHSRKNFIKSYMTKFFSSFSFQF